MMNTTKRAIVLTMMMALFALGSARAGKNYVSWAGNFYITIPEGWEQIDYQTVDAFLLSSKASEDVLSYDAVFAPSTSAPFFIGDYLILTVDTVGEMSQIQIDSVLKIMETTFGKDVKYYPVADFLADMKSNEPSYDTDQKLATVINDIVHRDQITKKLMLVTKFYDRGVANFYFYSPDSLFEQSKDTFRQIVQSFSTENIEAAAGKARVKVANVHTKENNDTEDDDDSVLSPNMLPFLGLLIVIIVLIARKKKRAR